MHEGHRELIALRLYDELSDEEEARLEEHLRACASCRSFATELRTTLGGLPRGGEAEELPADWVERLARAAERPAPARAGAGRRRSLVAFATGIAAGLVLALSIPRDAGAPASSMGPAGHEGVDAAARLVTNAGSTSRFLSREAMPPRATSDGVTSLLVSLGGR